MLYSFVNPVVKRLALKCCFRDEVSWYGSCIVSQNNTLYELSYFCSFLLVGGTSLCPGDGVLGSCTCTQKIDGSNSLQPRAEG